MGHAVSLAAAVAELPPVCETLGEAVTESHEEVADALGEAVTESQEEVADAEGDMVSSDVMVCVTVGGGSVMVTDEEKEGDTEADVETLPDAVFDAEVERDAEDDPEPDSGAEPLWLAEEEAEGERVAWGLADEEAEAEVEPDSVPGMSVMVGGGGNMVSVARSLRDVEGDSEADGDVVSAAVALAEPVDLAEAV